MLNENVFQQYPEMLEYPLEFKNFIRLCYGIDIDTKKMATHTSREDIECCAIVKEIELGTDDVGYYSESSENTLGASWIDKIDHEEIVECLKDYQNVEENERFWRQEGYTEAEISSKLSDDERVVKALKELYNKKTPYGFEGHLVTSDLAVFLKNNLIQAVITPQNGGIVIIEGKLDDNRLLKTIRVKAYDSLFSVTEFDDGYGIINCNNIIKKSKELESRGVSPTSQKDMEFQQLLSECNLEDYYDKPIAAIYYAKNHLVEQMLEMGKSKK